MSNQATALSKASEDELRLLGNYSGDTAHDAYFIPKPGSQDMKLKMPSKGIPKGGPKPRNDLAPRAVNTPYPNSVKARTGPSDRPALDLEPSRGNNVTAETRSKHFPNHMSHPPAKRRKVEDWSASISDDDLSSNPTTYFVSHKSQIPKTSHTPSLQSQISERYTNRHLSQSQPYNGSKISEFRTLEETMNSGHKGQRRRGKGRMIWSQPNHRLETLPSDTSPKSQPIDLDSPTNGTNGTKHKVRSQPTYKGTARNVEVPPKNLQRPVHPAESPEVIHVYAQKKPKPNQISPAETNMRHQFIDSLGTRRNSDAFGSSDELAGGTSPNTISSVGQFSRPAPRGISNTSQGVLMQKRMADSMEDIPGMPKSIILPKVLNPSRIFEPPKTSPIHPREEFVPWGMSLTYVNTGPQQIISNGLGFVLSEDEKEFKIRHDGCIHHSDAISKLLRLIWSQSSKKVRLETSKTGIHDSKLDLELGSERDVNTLITKLQNLTPQLVLILKTSETMDKLFQTRIQEWEKAGRHGQKTLVGEAKDIGLMRNNKERRDLVKDLPRRLDAANGPHAKRQRVSTRGGKKVDQPQAYDETDELQKALGSDPPRGVSDHQHPTLISDIFHRLGTDNQNPHLRQTRSRTSLGNPTTKDNDSIVVTEAPIYRFSERVGLGKPWTKPLIYPKDGRKKTIVEFSDLERLDEGEFLNDNLIGMYLRFLESKLEETTPKIAKKVYFFNTYFYSSLTTSLKGRGFNYEAVQKWTKMVDIFDYDYLVVPINESAHWYVAVICNLPELYRKPDPAEHAAIPALASKESMDDCELTKPQTQPRQTEKVNHVNPTSGDEAEKPSEREARESFEDLSLACDDKRSSPGRQLAPMEASTEIQQTDRLKDMSTDDLQLLEAQIRSDLSQSIPVSDLEVPGTEDTTADCIVAADPQHPASAKARRTKRKSNPPTNAYDPLQPTVITFDSLGTTHPQTTKYLKRYLIEEAQTRGRGMPWEDSRIKGMTASKIPMQDNFCDCGLFLLGYMEKFVVNPEYLISNTLRREIDANKDWPDFDASELRNRLREIIQTLHTEQEHERREERKSSASKVGKYHSKGVVKSPSSPSENAAKSTISNQGQGGTAQSTLSNGISGILDFQPAVTEVSDTTNRLNGHTKMDAGTTTLDEASGKRTLQNPIIVVDSQSDTQHAEAFLSQPHNLREAVVDLSPVTPQSPSPKHQLQHLNLGTQAGPSSPLRDRHSTIVSKTPASTTNRSIEI